jgi:hypothetical protein
VLGILLCDQVLGECEALVVHTMAAANMSLFDRRGAKSRTRRRSSSCHHESLTQLEAGGAERVEVSVPALDEDSGHGVHARRVLVSATGECTPVNEDGDSIGGDEDLQDESMVGAAEVTRERRRQERKLSLPSMSFGKLTESFEDKVVDAFLWLLKQTQGKQIHATKVPTYSRISSFSMPPDS